MIETALKIISFRSLGIHRSKYFLTKVRKIVFTFFISNLVKNSIQATENIEDPKITVSIKKVRKKAIIEIQDNGVGVPKNIKEKIFEPKFTTKSKGMGLGLSIIKNLVTNYNGNIDFSSKKGSTIFKIELHISY